MNLLALLVSVLLAQPGAGGQTAAAKTIRVSVLPLASEKDQAEAAAKVQALLEEVLAGMPGVELRRVEDQAPACQEKLAALRERCGDQKDCRLRMGRLLQAQLLIYGSASGADGQGAFVDLSFLDVGSACAIHKVSRSLMGSPARQRRSLEACLTEVLFPRRLVGDIALDIEPEGAAVYLDGKLRIPEAKASETLRGLRANSHTLRICKDGYADFYAIVQVPYRNSTQLVVRMRPAQGAPLGNVQEKDPWAIAPDEAWYEHWWVWVVVGAVVAGGVTAGIVLGQ